MAADRYEVPAGKTNAFATRNVPITEHCILFRMIIRDILNLSCNLNNSIRPEGPLKQSILFYTSMKAWERETLTLLKSAHQELSLEVPQYRFQIKSLKVTADRCEVPAGKTNAFAARNVPITEQCILNRPPINARRQSPPPPARLRRVIRMHSRTRRISPSSKAAASAPCHSDGTARFSFVFPGRAC